MGFIYFSLLLNKYLRVQREQGERYDEKGKRWV
jgi:hypothetical protein